MLVDAYSASSGLITDAMELAHWIAGFIVVAEGLNKLHRTAPLASGLSLKARAVVLMKAAAWILLVLGAAGALVRPFLFVAIAGDLRFGGVLVCDEVSLADLLALGGFALLIVRSRLKEPKA